MTNTAANAAGPNRAVALRADSRSGRSGASPRAHATVTAVTTNANTMSAAPRSTAAQPRGSPVNTVNAPKTTTANSKGSTRASGQLTREAAASAARSTRLPDGGCTR